MRTTPVQPDRNAKKSAAGSGRRRVDWPRIRPWIGTVARVVLAGVFLYAGGSKVSDLAASGRAVNAYEVMPIEMARFVGAVLPLVEVMLGLLLIAGLATRLAAAVTGGLFVVFITGIVQAWARGLSIDCGCFGGGGQIDAAQTQYAWEIIRDLGLLALAAYLVVFPRTEYSLDARLAGPKEIE